MKLQSRSEVDRLTGYMSAMSLSLNGCNYVTWFSAKRVEFENEMDFSELECQGRSGLPLDSQLQELVYLAYPQSKPEFATVSASSQSTMMRKLAQFISYINTDDGARSLVMPKKQDLLRGFWQHVKECADIEKAQILEYIPAVSEDSRDDELGCFIFWGFTFLIFNQDRHQCLILHCGASD